MALPAAARRAIAIRNSIAKKAGNDDTPKAPRVRLALPDFVATVLATDIKIGDTTAGTPFMTLKGCEVTLANGTDAVRTVMAFDEAYDAVHALITDGKDVVATLSHTGGTLKIIGLEIDGEMKMFDQPKHDAKAA